MRGLLNEGLLQDDAKIQAVYAKVYNSVDLSELKPDPLLRQQIEMLAETGDVQWWIASNSPLQFVHRVLRMLGLDPLKFHIVSPTSASAWSNKPSETYYDRLPRMNACLFDDSMVNCLGAEAVGLPAKHIDGSADVIGEVADWLGVVPKTWRLPKRQHLRAKEIVDLRSLSSEVLAELQTYLTREAESVSARGSGDPLRVLDVGAGQLSMLQVVIGAVKHSPMTIEYVAADTDAALLEAAAERLQLEFGAKSTSCPHTWSLELHGHQVKVELRHADVIHVLQEQVAIPYNLIVGCSILDLVDVREVAAALRKQHADTLLYFPINYVGLTNFEPASAELKLLTSHYNEALVARGHVTCIDQLVPLMGSTLAQGNSSWNMQPQEDLHMYRHLASVMAINALGYHPRQDVCSAVAAFEKMTSLGSGGCLSHLCVTNNDFLLRTPVRSETVPDSSQKRKAIEFVSPGVAHVVEEELPMKLLGEMHVRTILSAVSAGTERRVLLSGLEADGEPLDASLSALTRQASGWPIRYGYCLVGQVESSDTISKGTRVFCFHPHASVACVAESECQLIPSDITDEDAVFFANMETACALLQDGNPVLGDQVAVYGAGVVGMLTASVLAHSKCSVSIFDPNAARISTLCERFPEVRPGVSGEDVDLSIEISGASAALADAVSRTRRGGKVVIGSLYSETDVPLHLGLRFHRSEMTMIASQVSRVPASLSSRWTKQRRAELVWDMIRRLRPASWVPTQHRSIEEAPLVYKQLGAGASEGDPVQVIFRYDWPEQSM
eukprot:TRINITY_DN26984_c0_g2_i1.p1 TRINITY_DN26984_c0_g2~~TRINITY_DN26984_c0_g2_i1.p1  ORF type:complete len:912 (+),score=94.85 TRINITY_DN26984_c0_g2_i1:392-2737(+)